MSRFDGEHTLLTTATPEAIWRRWTTAEAWAEDDPDCRWARFDGPLAVGSTGTVKAAGPASHFTVTELEPHHRMTFEIRTPLGVLAFPHTVTPHANGVLLTHALRVRGPGAPVLGLLVGRRIVRGLPAVVQLVADHALEG